MGTFAIPPVGSSYADQNFGTPVTVLSVKPSQAAYHTPSALSATGLYAAIAVNGVTTVINATTGAVVRTNAPGFIANNTIMWDKNMATVPFKVGS